MQLVHLGGNTEYFPYNVKVGWNSVTKTLVCITRIIDKFYFCVEDQWKINI